jgi:hypothetical protein
VTTTTQSEPCSDLPSRSPWIAQMSTLVDRVVVGDEAGVVIHARGREVAAAHVVLCAKGFTDRVGAN